MKKIYQSFLLRMWISFDADQTTWQASLEDPHTREIVSFHNGDELIEFIQNTIKSLNTEQESNA